MGENSRLVVNNIRKTVDISSRSWRIWKMVNCFLINVQEDLENGILLMNALEECIPSWKHFRLHEKVLKKCIMEKW